MIEVILESLSSSGFRQIYIWIVIFAFFTDSSTFVKSSTKFSVDLWKKKFTIPEANASLQQWNVIDTCFFLRAALGLIDYITTDSLSQNVFVGPLIGMPIMRNLNP